MRDAAVSLPAEETHRMIAALLSLDKPLGSRLIRPFFLAGSTLSALLGLFGLMLGVAALSQSTLLGLIVVLLGLLTGITTFLAVRVVAEAATILFRAEERASTR